MPGKNRLSLRHILGGLFTVVLVTFCYTSIHYRILHEDAELRAELIRLNHRIDAMSMNMNIDPQVAEGEARLTLPGAGKGEKTFQRPVSDITILTKEGEGKVHVSHHPRTAFERLQYLETKFNGYSTWLTNPQAWGETTYKCKNITNLCVNESQSIFYDHNVCFDNFEQNKEDHGGNCVVYDFGIRQQPHFGEAFATRYGCEVHAFDPSPITKKWVDTKPALLSHPNYHFHPYGAGGVDGTVNLYEYYDWDQVSIVKYPPEIRTNKEHPEKRGNQYFSQKNLFLKVKKMSTIMQELKHDYVNILKLDVEGSEYLFLEEVFDVFGCPPVDQIIMEYHHFSIDSRYGASPEVNMFTTLLAECGFKLFWTRPSWIREDDKTQKQFRYGLNSYCKSCK